MDDPTRRNRLDEEESPYLRQHADNPVNWQPWDEAALEAANERDVPIFLSIGYSACHWCHVMEEESFEDEAVADVLNENFVPIKVDREERPDVDSIYMTVCQLVTGQGGWPLSAWLTPEGKPFFIGTYFPPEEQRGQPGFRDLCERISDSWASDEDRPEMETRAEQWTDAAKDRLEETPDAADADAPGSAGPPSSDVLETAADAILRSADREYGGFGSGGPKFPQPARLRVLARAYDRTGREECLEVFEEALDAMAAGGLYDHVGGGFHRYCVDRDWTVPHFEKMLYDNAEIPRAFLSGYQLTGRDRYATVVSETLAFVDRELTHDEGGFFSTLDAQSESPETGEREEGAFYVWTPDEVREVLESETDASLFCARYDISESGNFEGRNQPNRVARVSELAAQFDLEESEILKRLESARQKLFEAREERPRPDRDEKVLAGWNGLMISTYAEAALVLGEDEYAETAVDALEFVRDRLWDDDEGRLSRRYKDGDVKVDGYLEDYAFLARGALDCYQATGEVDHLAFALELARVVEAEFWDADRGTLYFTPESGESLVTRPQELGDQSTPSATGVAVETLLALDAFAAEDFEGIAATVLETHANTIEASAIEHATLSLAADRLAAGALEVTVAADELPDEWRERFASRYLPDRLFALRPSTETGLESWLDQLRLGDAPAIWAGREARDGDPTLYVCRDRTCSPPTHDVEDALEWLGENADAVGSSETRDESGSPF
ncbi:thioredoxin domain-containing protein [Natrinema salsiterrestre]|uniref:Thioredoxin domain-containing protein n=1 Tax=Natrinema salsiterrestre TaxID=2950540 RepID=A0A9Q4Q3S5_9EURY|nr:thioredoxin domain-containing protein [Natrinema salsiterrestre]MDF9746538.1 thioredoxin domain-containing protein [Natrinema salsiterrestre]